MKNNLTPEEKAKQPMTIQERELWAASHKLPNGILLIYNHEMMSIQQKVVRTNIDLVKWQNFGLNVLQSQTPEEAVKKLDEVLLAAEQNKAALDVLLQFWAQMLEFIPQLATDLPIAPALAEALHLTQTALDVVRKSAPAPDPKVIQINTRGEFHSPAKHPIVSIEEEKS